MVLVRSLLSRTVPLMKRVDVYCYACDDAKLDPRLSEHLANFGIQILGRTKTEKSMTELVSFASPLRMHD